MTNIPLGDSGYEIERVPINDVRNGNLLIFDFGRGPQTFEVNAIGLNSKQDPPGVFVNTITLTLIPSDGGPPQMAERPSGTEVARVIKSDNN